MENYAAKLKFEISDGRTMEEVVVMSVQTIDDLPSKIRSYAEEMLEMNPSYTEYSIDSCSKTKHIQCLEDGALLWNAYRENRT